MNELQIYTFQNRNVRVAGSPDAPLFVAADVCRILDLTDVTSALRGLEDDEKGPLIVRTLGGDQSMNAVTESGLFALVFKSRKPEAKAFRKWVTSEVLPAIRKTGSYQQPGASLLDMSELVCKVLREHEQRLNEHDQQLNRVEALLIQANSYNGPTTGFFTVRVYANVHGLRLSLTDVKEIGRRAASVCRRYGITVGRARDELFGELNSYPVEVLEEAFEAEFQKVSG
jgi:prophage antirepressor-like protein